MNAKNLAIGLVMVLILALAIIMIWGNSVGNPAYSYCVAQGNEYQDSTVYGDTVTKAKCIFPDGQSCDAIDFYTGVCKHNPSTLCSVEVPCDS